MIQMKVRVKEEFKDKYTGDIHRVGDELVVSLERINEIMKVGNYIELVDQAEQETPAAEQNEQTELSEQTEQQETTEDGEQQETPAADPDATAKRSTRRSRK